MNSQVWCKDLERSKSNETTWPALVFMFPQSADGDAQTLTEVDLFISTQRIKVLNADSQVSTSEHTHTSCFCPKRLHEATHQGSVVVSVWHKLFDTNCFLWKPRRWLLVIYLVFNLVMSLSEFPWTEDKNRPWKAKKCCTNICARRVTQYSQAVWLQHNLPSFKYVFS